MRRERPQCAIIALSGNGEPLAEARQAGAHALLQKPFHLEEQCTLVYLVAVAAAPGSIKRLMRAPTHSELGALAAWATPVGS